MKIRTRNQTLNKRCEDWKRTKNPIKNLAWKRCIVRTLNFCSSFEIVYYFESVFNSGNSSISFPNQWMLIALERYWLLMAVGTLAIFLQTSTVSKMDSKGENEWKLIIQKAVRPIR